MTSTHAHTAETGRHARGRAAAVRHRPRVGPRPRRVRRRPAALRAPAEIRRHLRDPDAVAAAAGRTDATLGRLGRPGHARPRDRRPRPGRAPAPRAGEPHQPLPRAHHQPHREAAADGRCPSVAAETDADSRRGRGGWPQICGYPHRCGYRHSCGQGHGCGQGGRRSAAQPKASDRESSSPHPSTPTTATARTASDGGGGADDRSKPTRCSPGAGSPTCAALAERCQTARRALGLSPTRWAARVCWPPSSWRCCAAGRPSRSNPPCSPSPRTGRPAHRCGWPRPDRGGTSPHRPPPELDGVDLAALEAELDDVAEHRPALQAKARAELAAEHLPVTRATVTARAVQILHRSRQEVA